MNSRWADWPVGRSLSTLSLTPTVSDIVAMSLATRDFHPVHHDVSVARALGHPEVFLNIMSTSALVERFVLEGLGGMRARLVSLKLRLGVPHYAGETLTLEGEVVESAPEGENPSVEVAFSGSNGRGRHVHGVVRLARAAG